MTVTTERPTLDVDPFSRAVQDDPVPTDRAIREAGPVVWLPKYSVWATGRDAVVREVFEDWERFSSAFGTGMTNVKRDEPWRTPSVILEADPPLHTHNRRALARVLSPKALAKLREDFRKIAGEMVAPLVAKGRFDLHADLALASPFRVLPDSVGMRSEGREHLMPYSKLNFNAMGPKNDLYTAARAVCEEMGTFDYVAGQMSRENLEPGGFGADIYAAVDAGDVSEMEAGMLVRAFISAGIDTTVFGIGLTLLRLMENPGQWDMLHADPSLAKAAFEEGLRHSPPSPVIGRTTPAPTELAGVQLGAEEKVLMFLSAANRDPERWERPDAFDITRRTIGHLSFGTGIHNCVGQMVARLEADAVITALAQQVRTIRLTAAPELFHNNWLRGYSSIPVEVEPA